MENGTVPILTSATHYLLLCNIVDYNLKFDNDITVITNPSNAPFLRHFLSCWTFDGGLI